MSCPLNWLFWHLSTLLHSRSFLVHGVKGVLTRWWCLSGDSCMGSCCCNYSLWMRLIKVFTQTHGYGWVLLSEGSRRRSHITSFVLKTCLFLQIGSVGWVLAFHFLLASCWGLTWTLQGGWRRDCSASLRDRCPSSGVFFLVQPADFYLF